MDLRGKTEKSEQIDKHFDLTRELGGSVEYKSDCDINSNWCIWNSPQGLGKGIKTFALESRRNSFDFKR